MDVERIEEIRLSESQEAEIAALLQRTFGEEFEGRSYFIQRHHVRLVVRDGELIGHVAIGFRSVRQGNTLIPVATLAEVATDPDRRREGIATHLVNAAVAEASSGVARFVLLFGDAALYSGIGFKTVHNQMRYVDMEGARTKELVDARANYLMVLPLRDQAWDEKTPIDLLGHLF